MKVVLDTNCLLSCIGKRSSYRNVFDAFIEGRYELCVSTEILLEYEEKFMEFWGEAVTHNLLGFMLTAPNASMQDIFYFFNLVQGDVDDNKFADTYIASIADILVSNDKKLLALNDLVFPPIKVMRLEEFSELLKTL
ncbi:MAG: putative toxin-antitoxin system toxin component, PIN family [Bacteroidetes bacterium]|nr:putative toxin-antitoxin system toxin component, PIN family [Bacteroidota bacterium]